MGTRIPPPYEPPPVVAGVACAICWGTGKPFGAEGPPATLPVMFSGVNKGPDWVTGDPEPIEGVFDLPQDPFDGCDFGGIFPQFSMTVSFKSTETEVLAYSNLGPVAFYGKNLEACQEFVNNEENSTFVGGTCRVYIPEILP